MTGNVVISEVDALLYVVLSKAEKHVPYWGIGWYHRMCKEHYSQGVAQTVVIITEFSCTFILVGG